MAIKNIVFDVGNVLVRWDRELIIKKAFPHRNDYGLLAEAIFKHETWFSVNKGHLTEAQAILEYQKRLSLDHAALESMMQIAKESLIPVEGSFELLEQLHQQHYALYALTDNTHEFMRYLKSKYDFWDKFKGIVVSANLGYLKPSPEIYDYLLNTFNLIPTETIFIDDLLVNIEGAQAKGIHGIQFQNSEQCFIELQALLNHSSS